VKDGFTGLHVSVAAYEAESPSLVKPPAENIACEHFDVNGVEICASSIYQCCCNALPMSLGFDEKPPDLVLDH
jgi:hypothetical protein